MYELAIDMGCRLHSSRNAKMENKRKSSLGGSGVGEPALSQRKKQRGGDWDEDGPSQFEEELAFLDEMESEIALEVKEVQLESDDIPLGEFGAIFIIFLLFQPADYKT